MTNDAKLFQALLRTDFTAFFKKVFSELHPGTEYLHNWHVDAIAWELERVLNGESKRLIINIPPRYGKSLMVSVAYVAFLLGHDPSLKIIVVSYADKLAIDLSRMTRLVMQSDWYRKTFPGTRLSKTKNTEQMFYTTKNGFRYAATTGGTLTGIGGDIIIIDDIIKPEDAFSDVLRTKANQFYSSTLLPRLNDKMNGPIIYVGQRLHDDDLVGHILDKDTWTHLKLPVLATTKELIPVGEGLFNTRSPGEPLHPEREGETEIKKLRKVLGEMVFSAQYQQEPIPPGGDMLKLEWFERYDVLPPGHYFECVILSWDTAVTASETSDYSVCTVWAKRGDLYYLINVFRDKLDYPDLEKVVWAWFEKYQPKLVIIEGSHIGKALCSTFRQKGHFEFVFYDPKYDKVARAAHQSAKIEAERVFLPTAAPWLEDFEKEVLQFPNGKHDDQVDSMIQFLYIMDRDLGHRLR